MYIAKVKNSESGIRPPRIARPPTRKTIHIASAGSRLVKAGMAAITRTMPSLRR